MQHSSHHTTPSPTISSLLISSNLITFHHIISHLISSLLLLPPDLMSLLFPSFILNTSPLLFFTLFQLSEKPFVDLYVRCLCSGERSWVRFQAQNDDSKVTDPGTTFQGISLGSDVLPSACAFVINILITRLISLYFLFMSLRLSVCVSVCLCVCVCR